MSNASIYNEGPQIEAEDGDMAIEYRGEQGPLFKLGLKTSLLTLVTLGIYRFWAKTRLRKYFWSATARRTVINWSNTTATHSQARRSIL